jgi:hypothetical protein
VHTRDQNQSSPEGLIVAEAEKSPPVFAVSSRARDDGFPIHRSNSYSGLVGQIDGSRLVSSRCLVGGGLGSEHGADLARRGGLLSFLLVS